MAMLSQSSFRRILLARVLLLSIPILLLGVAVTFRKARTSLLNTARINLTESAQRKADVVEASIDTLRSNLAIASQTEVLRSGDPVAVQSFLTQMKADLPIQFNCLQLVDLQTQVLIASTCGDTLIQTPSAASWASELNEAAPFSFRVNLLEPSADDPVQLDDQSYLNLAVSSPVYDPTGQLRYQLSARSLISQRENAAPWSFLGYTVIFNQDGTFLSHPVRDRIGRNIFDEQDDSRFQDILENALRGDSTVRHIDFLGDGMEWLAGFSPVTIPINNSQSEVWTVIAVTPLSSALKGLESITQILVILTTGLLSAHLLAMLYIARDLSRPIEQLSKYARRIHKRSPLERAPKNFRIRELNHLAEALDNMVSRLEERAKELETAWQEAEAANQLKSEFLANTSHELRTPLNAIIGCIRLVSDDCCDTREEELEFLHQADKAAVHLLKIINDLLDIRRIEESGLPLSMEVVDLRHILDEVIEIQVVQIQQKGLSLTLPNLKTPIWVEADPARLKQVLLNVLYNATKFTDKGGITVKVHIEAALDTDPADRHPLPPDETENPLPGAWVVVSIEDTGIGIDPAQQPKLFRPFVMVDGTTTRKFEGTGLGLAISRNLIEMMGGSISLHSDGLDQGTTVEISLPIVEQPQQPEDLPEIVSQGVQENGNAAASIQESTEHSAIGS